MSKFNLKEAEEIWQEFVKDNPFKSGEIHYLTMHWSAGGYNTSFEDYQLNILGDGYLEFSQDPYDYYSHPHTWHRNTNNFGISCACMFNANSPPWYYVPDLKKWPACYGSCPPTPEQIDSLIWVMSKLLRFYQLPAAAIMTHADFGKLDGYGPGSGDPETRWDWWKEGTLLKKKIIEEYVRTKPNIKK